MKRLLLFLLCSCMVIGTEQAPMTADDVAKIISIGEAVISPDGQFVAYQRIVQPKPFADDSASAYRELWVWDKQRGSRSFISGKVRLSKIQWRPGTQWPEISFLAKRDQDDHTVLYCIPADGGEARNVLSFESSISSYSWHPDGTKVVFIAKPKREKSKKELDEKGFNQQIYEEDILSANLYTASIDSEDEPVKVEIDGSVSEAHWSSTAQFISVAVAPDSLVDTHYMYRRIHILNASDFSLTWKLDSFGKMGHSFWSPDDTKFAFISGADINDPSPGRIFILDMKSGKLSKHFMNYPGHISSLVWLDGNRFRFLGARNTGTETGVYYVKKKIIGNRVDFGSLVVGKMSLDTLGENAALVGQNTQHPNELFRVVWNNKGEPTRLTDSNPWLEKIAMGRQEVIRYKAKDGLEIEGLLIYPVNYQKSEKYPLILTVHGGPEAHYSNTFLTRYSSPGQVAAGQGFFVFYPNYRGSTGRGLKFSKASQADAAGKEFDDLVDGVDFLIAQGFVDKDRVGITGGSYGGYATAWCSTYYSERFAAGVMFVGISNKVSKAGTTDIPDEETLVHALSRPWDKWQYFLERSPVYHVQKARTPLLIMHGKEDPRVHPGQSMELYRHIKTLGETPVRLVFYPGEGHGNRKSSARYDYNLRMMRWFNHFLKGNNTDKPLMDMKYPAQGEGE